MKTHLPSAVILCASLVLFCVHSFATENQTSLTASPIATSQTSGGSTSSSQGGFVLIPLSSTSVDSQDASLSATEPTIDTQAVETMVVEETTYLSAGQVLDTLFPEADKTWQEGTLTASSPDLQFHAVAGNPYFSVNGQYYYVPSQVIEKDGILFLPTESLAESLGCSLEEEPETGTLRMQRSGSLPTSPTYPEEDLYWLSRAIYAEAGNQPMAGRIAVGTVILNRVAHESFPDTVREVIFAPGQFSPVENGTIYRTPDEESVIAAKLCLDGVREAEDCLYFNVTSIVSWADQSRTYVCTIGDHNFYL